MPLPYVLMLWYKPHVKRQYNGKLTKKALCSITVHQNTQLLKPNCILVTLVLLASIKKTGGVYEDTDSVLPLEKQVTLQPI